jgi:YfiH family protein
MHQKSKVINTNHGFFGREGGVSGGTYASLNCGAGSGDDLDKVQQNREIVCNALGAEVLVTAKQTHSKTSIIVSGAGQYEGDALVTNTRGVAVAVLTADCTPILFYDADAGVVAAAHAGWRGAIGGIIDSTIAAMQSLGAKNIVAAIGPTIQQKSYEVGQEFIDNFAAESAENRKFFVSGEKAGKFMFDLPSYVEQRLRQNGITKIDNTGIDTLSAPEKYFSFRRNTLEGKTEYGRQVSAISLI